MFRLVPILRPMVWGSELWVLSGYPERMTVVADGPDKGLNINQLVAKYKEALVGRWTYWRFGDEFPLLVKFLDVQKPLSIQVHPSEQLARERHGAHGKNEMWYVIRAAEGAELMAGLRERITPEDYTRKVADGTITDVIAHHSIHEGDVFFIPTGRIHALLPGSYVAEIQQTSDMTYRIYDYNRPGLDGKPRELHTELAKDAIDYYVYSDYRTHYKHVKDEPVLLAECPFFSTSLLDLDRQYTLDVNRLDCFVILMCVGGSGTVLCDGQRADLSSDGCLLVPASAQEIGFEPGASGLKVLVSHL
ncbi:MAG: class I mannose-6-phosphate isomerase [Bacteroidales bacterium]|nr:class I mannose-6-phosphate isomerase [Bacteroidales bacterium]